MPHLVLNKQDSKLVRDTLTDVRDAIVASKPEHTASAKFSEEERAVFGHALLHDGSENLVDCMCAIKDLVAAGYSLTEIPMRELDCILPKYIKAVMCDICSIARSDAVWDLDVMNASFMAALPFIATWNPDRIACIRSLIHATATGDFTGVSLHELLKTLKRFIVVSDAVRDSHVMHCTCALIAAVEETTKSGGA